MAITSAFQADDVGSIPITRSTYRLSIADAHRGVEQRQLVGPITRRSSVRIRPPQQRKKSLHCGFFVDFFSYCDMLCATSYGVTILIQFARTVWLKSSLFIREFLLLQSYPYTTHIIPILVPLFFFLYAILFLVIQLPGCMAQTKDSALLRSFLFLDSIY